MFSKHWRTKIVKSIYRLMNKFNSAMKYNYFASLSIVIIC